MTALHVAIAATVCLAVGFWLLLPRESKRGWALGVVLTAAGLGLLSSLAVQLSPEHQVADAVFLALAATTVVSALAAVSFHTPVYCALWFGLTLLGTAGLFLYQGAQFLGVATMVVYAGAILVTFLFVLMLAHPRGNTAYDRKSWEGALAAFAGAVLIGMLSAILFVPPAGAEQPPVAELVRVLAEPAATPRPAGNSHEFRYTAAERGREVLADEHMARLGAHLFSRHLIAVEVAGTLLLVALVGAVAIVAQGKQPRWHEVEHHG